MTVNDYEAMANDDQERGSAASGSDWGIDYDCDGDGSCGHHCVACQEAEDWFDSTW